ncbi:unnamed protein product, partial [Rotaria magnacalcarata]
MSYSLTENFKQTKPEYIDDKALIDIIEKVEEAAFWGDIKPTHKEDLKTTATSNLPAWVEALFVQHQKTG